MRAFIFLTALMASVSLSIAANGLNIGPASYDTGLVVRNTGGSNIAIYGKGANVGVYGVGANYGFGVLAQSDGYAMQAEAGEWGLYTFGGTLGYGSGGVYARGINYVSSSGAIGMRSDGEVSGGGQSFGVLTEAVGGDEAYGISAWASGASTNLAGYFGGNVAISGTCYPCVISDRMVKKNIRALDGGLDKIMALRPKAYEMKTEEFKELNFGAGTQYGLIAQEVEETMPEVVHAITAPAKRARDPKAKPGSLESLHLKSINYTSLIPVLVEAIQEQQKQIEAQALEIAALKRSK